MLELYDDPTALFYVDPPYPHATRVRRYEKMYANELTDADHANLCRRLLEMRSMVILSTYENPIYSDILAGWEKVQFRTRAQRNAPRVETLYINPAACRSRQPSLLEVPA